MLIRLVLVLVMMAGAGAVSSLWFPLTNSSISTKNGELLFQANCARCHAIAPGAASQMGPSLANIGRVAGERLPGVKAEEYLWDSILYPDKFASAPGYMPSTFGETFNNQQLRDLVGYLASRGSNPDYLSILKMEKPEGKQSGQAVRYSIADVVAGHKLFHEKYKCSTCHGYGEVHTGDDLVAPNLGAVGQYSTEKLVQSIREPSSEIHPLYKQVRALTTEGEVLVGRLIRSDSEHLVLLVPSSTGGFAIRSIDVGELEELENGGVVEDSKTSSMPVWAVAEMPDEDLRQLVTFLKTLQ